MELGVQRLILPAVPGVLNTWTRSFGFSKMTGSERLQFLDYTFLDFQDTVMCQKLLMKSPSPQSNPLEGLFSFPCFLCLKTSEKQISVYQSSHMFLYPVMQKSKMMFMEVEKASMPGTLVLSLKYLKQVKMRMVESWNKDQ